MQREELSNRVQINFATNIGFQVYRGEGGRGGVQEEGRRGKARGGLGARRREGIKEGGTDREMEGGGYVLKNEKQTCNFLLSISTTVTALVT